MSERTEIKMIPVEHGIELYTVANPVDQPRAAVIIVHGLCEHQGRYDYVVKKFNESGFAVYRFDNRGHGKSGGERGHLDDFHSYIDDTDHIVTLVKNDYPDTPVFMVGHSMGGFIAAGYGVKYPGRLTGQIFSGAAVILLPIFEPMAEVDFDTAPREKIPNALADLICRERNVVDDYVNDPLVLKETNQKLLGEVFVNGARWLVDNMSGYRYPCCILHGGGDQIVTPEASRYMMEHISSHDKSIRIYDDLYHEILNEFEKDQVIEDIRRWIDARI